MTRYLPRQVVLRSAERATKIFVRKNDLALPSLLPASPPFAVAWPSLARCFCIERALADALSSPPSSVTAHSCLDDPCPRTPKTRDSLHQGHSDGTLLAAKCETWRTNGALKGLEVDEGKGRATILQMLFSSYGPYYCNRVHVTYLMRHILQVSLAVHCRNEMHFGVGSSLPPRKSRSVAFLPHGVQRPNALLKSGFLGADRLHLLDDHTPSS